MGYTHKQTPPKFLQPYRLVFVEPGWKPQRQVFSHHSLNTFFLQEGKTALYWAVEKGHTEIVQLILDNDPDIEISNKVRTNIIFLKNLFIFITLSTLLSV